MTISNRLKKQQVFLLTQIKKHPDDKMIFGLYKYNYSRIKELENNITSKK